MYHDAKKLSETLYFVYEPKSFNCKQILFEVTTEEGLQEVARLAMAQMGHIHFASADEFAQASGMERLTDDCTSGKSIGAVADVDNDSVSFVAM